MLRKLTFLGCVVLLLAGCTTGDGNDYEIATLVMPEGHPDAGRQAFLKLGCASCHAVGWEPEFPAPLSANPGPGLDRSLTMQTAGGIATSIIVPSHYVPAKIRRTAEGQVSPMADYTEAMTVRQLIDVVSYLRAQGAETVARDAIEDQTLPPRP